jgi:serine/threonine-protein kinase
MSDQIQSRYDELPLPAQLRVDLMCRAYERAWRAGQPPALGPLLDGIPAQERLAFLQELVELLTAGPAYEPVTRSTVAFAMTSEGGVTHGSLASEELQFLEEIGRGAMGVVYKAFQPGLNRQVAVKMILAGDYADGASLQRFRVEAIAAGRLEHEGIVRVHDTGSREGKPYLIMEYVAGGSLKDRLDGTPWPAPKAAQLVEQLATIVQAAHDKQIIHRDLKPANILLTPDGRPKVSDFGLAKLLDAGNALSSSNTILGTYSYMPPEQASGNSKNVGPAADIYSLGAILYELLTGRPPFVAETVLETLEQVLQIHPVPPSRLQPKLPRDLETVCLKCLEKEPRRRYATAADLAEDLARYSAGRPVLARPRRWTDTLLWGLGQQHSLARTVWGKLALALGLMIFLIHGLLTNWLILTQQPPPIWWLTIGGMLMLNLLVWAHYLLPRRHELTPAECHLLPLWGGYALAVMVLWVAVGAPCDRSVLTDYYPPLAVLTGLAFVVQASVYWGRFYLAAAAFFALAIVMRFTPDWAALEMAVLYGGITWATSLYLLRRPDN